MFEKVRNSLAVRVRPNTASGVITVTLDGSQSELVFFPDGGTDNAERLHKILGMRIFSRKLLKRMSFIHKCNLVEIVYGLTDDTEGLEYIGSADHATLDDMLVTCTLLDLYVGDWFYELDHLSDNRHYGLALVEQRLANYVLEWLTLDEVEQALY